MRMSIQGLRPSFDRELTHRALRLRVSRNAMLGLDVRHYSLCGGFRSTLQVTIRRPVAAVDIDITDPAENVCFCPVTVALILIALFIHLRKHFAAQ